MEYKKNRHSVFYLKYHLILVTKYRHPFINKKINNDIKEIVKNICIKWELDLEEIETEGDHVHIMFQGKPQLQLSKFINNLKTVSSRLLKKSNSEHLKKFYWKPSLWEPSYFISTVGEVNEEVIKQYIKKQKSPIV